jgi:hypothetical protein
MKKSLFTALIIGIATLLTVCACKCTNDNTVVDEGELVVENTISTDREDMFLNYGKVYEWFETSVVYKNFLDEEAFDGTVESIVNVFQTIKKGEDALDTDVVLFTHTTDTTVVDVVKHEMWFEDFRLNQEEINLTFEQAYERLVEANCTKPHSRCVVLRKPVGPKVTNALYIFGGPEDHWYVDAKTGDVFNDDPGYTWVEVPVVDTNFVDLGL